MNQATPPQAAGSPPGATGAYAILHNRDFACYLTGRLVAAFGQQMLAMAVGWELYERTGSALALGFVGLAQMIPMIVFTLPAGHVADHSNRKHVVVWMTLSLAGVSLALTLISAWRLPVFWIYFCLFIAGTVRTFLWAASASFLPQLVARGELARAVNWSTSTFQLSSILGPAAAGAVLAWTHHAAWVYGVNVVAALTCGALVGTVRQHHVAAVKEKISIKALLTGFHFVFANRIVCGIITLDMFAVLLGGATALLPVYAKEILHVGPDRLGLLQTALPLGAIACSFILAHRPPLQQAGRALLWAVGVFGLATIAFGLSQYYWLSFALLLACGVADNVSVVVRHTLVQWLTPDDKRGRVSAVNNLFIGTSNELGGFESGAVAHGFGPAMGHSIAIGAMISVVSGGVGTLLVVAAIALLWPEIRKYGRLDGLP